MSDEETISEDSNPFGDWLRKAREEKELSVFELAQASGVSMPQIYNLESGRSRNPQDRTRSKLEKILGPMPQSVKVEAKEEQQVLDLGALIDFDPFEEEELPTCPGVYVFYDITDRPVYVGRATKRAIRSRVREHYEKFWFKRPVVDRGAYIEIQDEKLCMQVEQILIRFLKSNALFNKQYVDRD